MEVFDTSCSLSASERQSAEMILLLLVQVGG